MGLRKIPLLSKAAVDVYFKGQLLNTRYKPDLLVFGEIVVELKAVKAIATEHEAQLFDYMRISKKRVGYLINFGNATELEWKRFILPGKNGVETANCL